MKFSAAAVSLGNLFVGKVKTETEEFSDFFHKHQNLVRSVIFQIVGDQHLNDLSQEVFIRIWKNYEQFRKDSKVTSWIYRISVNVAIDALRQNKRRAELTDFDFAIIKDEKSNTENLFADRQIVQKGLMALHEEHRVVIVLSLIHDLPLKEIAEILKIPEGTVKSRLHYAKEHFKQFIAEISQGDSNGK